MTPPTSETVALIVPNTGAHAGAVAGHTRISPSLTWSISSALSTTRARPSTIPADAATPRN